MRCYLFHKLGLRSLQISSTFLFNLLSDLVSNLPISLIINLEQVMKGFLVWNVYLTFFYQCWFHFFTRLLKSNFMEI